MNKNQFKLLSKTIEINVQNVELFSRAFTDSSKSEINYERIEFLGDGILD